MKAKTIKIKSIDQGLDDFAHAFKKATSGLNEKPKKGVFFTSIEAARKILTPSRIKMMKFIKVHHPQSIYALAKGMERNIKNISEDLYYLSEMGLVEMKESGGNRRQKKPVLLSDHITVELSI